ncbi:ATPase [Opitutaceae bacterium TAV5]|nr:ATPase [Opitutaceae bacterium TAV5]
MIASVAFRNFKALRSTQIALSPFTLIIGPNGSGKTSLIQAGMRLRTLARLPLREPASAPADLRDDAPEIIFRFDPPHSGLEAILTCSTDNVCDLLEVRPLLTGEGADDWAGLRERLLGMRSYLFDHAAMSAPAAATDHGELAGDGHNLAAVLARRAAEHPAAWTALRGEFLRIFTEYEDIETADNDDGHTVLLRFRVRDEPGWITAEDVSQGTLYALGILTLAWNPEPPSLVCVEELDRGIHPRLLRELRDALYQLSYPPPPVAGDAGSVAGRSPTQVIATTHSPYLLDLFREHPEEVVIAEKHGRAAHFFRLSDRTDLAELLTGASLGDLWYSGILGGVPEERES